MPNVSVVIPTYNRRELLLEALRSVFAQTYQDYEVIVVDDGSTDRTAEAVQPLADRVIYLYKPNGGAASARNRGIAAARGKYLAFLDSDDFWEADFLRVTTKYLIEHPELAMVATAWRTWPSGHVWPGIRDEVLHGHLLHRLIGGRTVRTSAIVAVRERIERIGPFDESLEVAEDLDMWLRIASQYPIAFLNIALSWGRQHDSNISRNHRLLHLQRQLQVLTRHFDPAKVPEETYRRRCSSLYADLGRRQLKAGQIKEAEGSLRQAIDHRPLNLGAWCYLMRAWLQTSR